MGELNFNDLSLDDTFLLHGVSELTAEEHKVLAQYVGFVGGDGGAATNADGVNRTTSAGTDDIGRTSSAGSAARGSAAREQRRKTAKVASAKKWLLASLAEYEQERREDWQVRHVQEQRIFDTIAFGLHYLGDQRLTFNSHEQEWVNGLIGEMSRLKEAQDEMLLLDVVQPALLIVSKLLDLATPAYSDTLFDCCKMLARRVYNLHVGQGVPLTGRICGDLFKVFNNIACLLLQNNALEEAEEWIKDATMFVRDEEDDADVFLCNSASLISASSDNVKEVKELLTRAEKVVTGAQALHQNALQALADEIKTRQDKLLGVDNAFLLGIPPEGEEFLVRVEGDEVKMMASIVPSLRSEIARFELQVTQEQEKLQALSLRAMRTYRKLANFFARKIPAPQGVKRANAYTKQLMATVQSISCAQVPLNDDVSNACAVANYYLRWAMSVDAIPKRREYAQKCFDECSRAIQRIEAAWGQFHTSKRSAELYEKGVISAMLCREGTAIVQEWSVECVRLQKIHGEGSVYHARSLMVLSEGFGYAGDAEQALISGKDAHVVMSDLLGPHHMVTKKYNKIWIEHKKVMMKGGGKQAASKMFCARMESKQWIREWV